MSATYCEYCHHERTLNRCWRLTCPTNGGRGQALALARPGPFYRPQKDTLL